MEIIGALLLLAISLGIYLIPTFIANSRNHPNTTGIVILNIFLGWSLFGWVGALIWSLTDQGEQNLNSKRKKKKKNINVESRNCPHCAEKINKKAKICRYCHSKITPIYVEDKKVNNQIHKIITLHNDDNAFIDIAKILNDNGELYLKDNTKWNSQKVQYVVDNFKD